MKMKLQKAHIQSSAETTNTGDADDGLLEGANTIEEDEIRDENSINLNTVKKILLFWGLTVPVALSVSYGFSKLLLINVDTSVPVIPPVV